MASLVAEIEKAVQSKFLSEELNIETKLHHLCLHSQIKGKTEITSPEEARSNEEQAALKRNKEILKGTDLIVARYRSRSLYSPVDGHLQSCKLKYLKQLKALKHKELVARFRNPPELESCNVRTGVDAPTQHALTSVDVRHQKTSGILKTASRPSAYLVTGPEVPIPLPRTSLEATRPQLMSDTDVPQERGVKSTPVSAGLFRIGGHPLPVRAGEQSHQQQRHSSRQIRSTPASAGTSRTTAVVTRSRGLELSGGLESKPV